MIKPALSRWISVDEFLPDEGLEVLVFGVWGEYEDDEEDDDVFFEVAEISEGRWVEVSDFSPLYNVTHWQLFLTEDVDTEEESTPQRQPTIADLAKYNLSIVRLNDGRWMCGQFGDSAGIGYADTVTGSIGGYLLYLAVADNPEEAIAQAIYKLENSEDDRQPLAKGEQAMLSPVHLHILQFYQRRHYDPAEGSLFDQVREDKDLRGYSDQEIEEFVSDLKDMGHIPSDV